MKIIYFAQYNSQTTYSLAGQHMKKSSMSESSSDIMDLDDGIDATSGLTDHPGRHLAPFLRAQQSFEKQQLQLQQQQNGLRGQTNTLQLRHNSAMAVSIETDVWLLGKSKMFNM